MLYTRDGDHRDLHQDVHSFPTRRSSDLAGVFLAIPSAAIINRIGTKKLLLGLMVVLCIGNVIGGVAPNYTVLLIGRCIEGIAFAMIIVDALTMINGWFGDHAGVAIGIFSTYATVSSFVTMNACLPIVHFLGIRSLWFIIATLACLCIGLAYMVIEEPKIDTKSQQIAFREVMGNGKMWLAGIALGALSFIIFGYMTAYPQLFTDFYHLAPVKANFYTSLNGLFGIPLCILSGAVVDKTNKPLRIAFWGFIGLCVVALLNTALTNAFYVLHTAATALLFGLVITAIYYIAPLMAKRPEATSYTLGCINCVYYIGIFITSPIVVSAVARFGWGGASGILALAGIVGAAVIGFLMRQCKGLIS